MTDGFSSRRRRLPTTRARRTPLCGDTIPPCTVDSAVTKQFASSDGIRMWDIIMGTLYGEQATLECQQQKTRRRSPAPVLMLISPVVGPQAGRATGTAGTRKHYFIQIAPPTVVGCCGTTRRGHDALLVRAVAVRGDATGCPHRGTGGWGTWICFCGACGRRR